MGACVWTWCPWDKQCCSIMYNFLLWSHCCIYVHLEDGWLFCHRLTLFGFFTYGDVIILDSHTVIFSCGCGLAVANYNNPSYWYAVEQPIDIVIIDYYKKLSLVWFPKIYLLLIYFSNSVHVYLKSISLAVVLYSIWLEYLSCLPWNSLFLSSHNNSTLQNISQIVF